MSDMNIVLEALEYVTSFNKEVVLYTLSGKDVEEGKIEKIKNACEILSGAGVYEFDTNCTVKELLLQIEDFMNLGLQRNSMKT